MRIKLFENFNHKPFILDSFDEAEGKLEGKDGIVLSGVKGDITHIEAFISKIQHTECYVLVTKQDGPAQNWESDVFLVGAKENDPDIKNAKSIKAYFDGEEEEWTDPAGGTHSGDEVDGAAMYEATNNRDMNKNKTALKKELEAVLAKYKTQLDPDVVHNALEDVTKNWFKKYLFNK